MIFSPGVDTSRLAGSEAKVCQRALWGFRPFVQARIDIVESEGSDILGFVHAKKLSVGDNRDRVDSVSYRGETDVWEM